MKTIRIDRLHLKCRGVAADIACAALGELGPALRDQFGNGARDVGGLHWTGKNFASICVPARVTPSLLAGAVAACVAEAVQTNAGSGNTGRKT